MATKAERFRYELERSGEKKVRQPERPKGRGDGGGELAHHNTSERAGRKAAYALEEVGEGRRPSRKSTRKAANRQKNDVQYRLERKVSQARPESRPQMP